jgi:hypothetical protein
VLAGNIPVVQAEQCFTNRSLRGAWGFSAEGVLEGIGPGNAVGLYTFNGEGVCTFRETLNITGVGSFARAAETCTYSVHEDGTGTASRTFPDGSESNIAFVLLLNQKELRFILTDDGAVVTGVAKKQ